MRAWPGRLAAATALGFLAAELLLRILGVSFLSSGQWDAERGHAYRPGTQGWFRSEGEGFIRINAAGYRGPEWRVEKPPNTFRVAVLGDSYTAAFQVDYDSTFCAILERGLARCLRRPVEVLNFGVVGYSTAQELITLRKDVWRFSPDLVLLAVCTGNDIRDNHRRLANASNPRPFYQLRDGELVLDASFRDRFEPSPLAGAVRATLGDLARHSRVLQLARHARGLVAYRRAQTPANAGDDVAGRELGLTASIYGAPPDSTWREAWVVTDRLFEQIHREVEAEGARLMVVTLTQSIQVDPDPSARQASLQALRETFDEPDLHYAEKRIAALGRRSGFAVVNLVYPFLEHVERHGTFVHGFETGGNLGRGHWNENGHRLAGRILTGALCGFVSDGAATPRPTSAGADGPEGE